MYSERPNNLGVLVVILIYYFFNRYLNIVSYSLCYGLNLSYLVSHVTGHWYVIIQIIFSGKEIQTSKYNHLIYINDSI